MHRGWTALFIAHISSEYARSSRLASHAPHRSRCDAGFYHRLLGAAGRGCRTAQSRMRISRPIRRTVESARGRPALEQPAPGRARRGPAAAARGAGVPASSRRGFGAQPQVDDATQPRMRMSRRTRRTVESARGRRARTWPSPSRAQRGSPATEWGRGVPASGRRGFGAQPQGELVAGGGFEPPTFGL